MDAGARDLRYRLMPVDALAWEQMQPASPRVMRTVRLAPWAMMALSYALTTGAGLGVGVQTVAAVVAGVGTFIAAQYLLARAMHQRARLRVPQPVEMACHAADGMLTAHPVTDAPGAGRQVIPAQTIRQIVTTPERLFLDAGDQVLILPLAAFADGDDMRHFGEHWTAAARAATDGSGAQG